MQKRKIPFFLTRNKQDLLAKMDELVEEMQEKQLMSFCGDAPWLYFQFHYCDPEDRDFSELSYLHLAIESAAGRAGVFKGCLCIEISQWLEHEKEDYFDVLLCYLHDRSDHVFPAFYVANEEEHPQERIEALYHRIAGYFLVEWLEIRSCKTREYMVQMRENLVSNGLPFSKEGEAYAEKIIEEMQDSPYFMGRITIDNFCEDLWVYVERKGIKKRMTEENLYDYVKDSNYLQCFMKKEKNEQGIGLIRRKEGTDEKQISGKI